MASSTAALEARIAAYQAGVQPAPPVLDPVVLTSTLNTAVSKTVPWLRTHAISNPDTAPNGMSSGDVATITGGLEGFHFITDIRTGGQYGSQIAVSDTNSGNLYTRSFCSRYVFKPIL
jgi:hypothetical protein